MGAVARFERDFEGGAEPRAIDAPHWIRVYRELIGEVEAIAAAHPEHAARLLQTSHRFRQRLEFWVRLRDSEAAG